MPEQPTYRPVQKALHRPLTTGARGMVGHTGVVRTALDPEGQVLVDGELWRAVTPDGPVPPGEHVQIVSVDGLTLTVTRNRTAGVGGGGGP